MADPRRGGCRQRLAVGWFRPPWAAGVAVSSLAGGGKRHGAAAVRGGAGLLRGGLLAYRFGGVGLLGGTSRLDGLGCVGRGGRGVVFAVGSAASARRFVGRAVADRPAPVGRDRLALADECSGRAVPGDGMDRRAMSAGSRGHPSAGFARLGWFTPGSRSAAGVRGLGECRRSSQAWGGAHSGFAKRLGRHTNADQAGQRQCLRRHCQQSSRDRLRARSGRWCARAGVS